jgi:hypothetical protein
MFGNAEVCAAYIAGFFDGEGCISAQQSPAGNYWVKVTFSQKNVEQLEMIQDNVTMFWGIASSLHYNGRGRDQHLTGVLSYTTNNAARIARILMPYAALKKEQLEWVVYTWDNHLIEGTSRQDKAFLAAQLENRPRTIYETG